jgi:hypothetical protein
MTPPSAAEGAQPPKPLSLYLFDEKHQNVFAEHPCGVLTGREAALVGGIAAWLTQTFDSRHKRVVLAHGYETAIDPDDDWVTVEFDRPSFPPILVGDQREPT